MKSNINNINNYSSNKPRVPIVNIKLNNQTVKRLHQYNYLGSTLTRDSRCLVEKSHRIVITKSDVTQKRQLLTNNDLNLKTRKNFTKSYV